jgi:hypothetical protein
MARWFQGRPKLSTSAVPRFGKPLLQGELSLDSIKVVRNDLSDSDLELVPVRPAPEPASEVPALKTTTKPGPSGQAWSRMGSRLSGAGKL